MRRSNIRLIRVPEGENNRENEEGQYLEMMAAIFQELAIIILIFNVIQELKKNINP